MPGENQNNNSQTQIDENNQQNQQNQTQTQTQTTTQTPDDDLVNKVVEERLKEIKANLDKAYKARDEAQKRAAELELKEREAEKKKLEEAGEYKKLYELQLKEKEEENQRLAAEKAALESRNTELTRDAMIKDALKGLPFRNAVAHDMAYGQIVNQIARNDKGDWVHKSGVSIKDFVDLYSKDENNSFLFKAKASSGAGTGNNTQTTDTSTGNKSLYKMSQADVMKMAAEGKLPNQRK
jgi:hypothetical protein